MHSSRAFKCKQRDPWKSASLNSKDASVDDAEFVNAFIKGF